MKIVGKRCCDDDITNDTQAISNARKNPGLNRAKEEVACMRVADSSSSLSTVVDVVMRCTYKFTDMTRSNGISATVQMGMKCRHTNPGTCRRRNIRNIIEENSESVTPRTTRAQRKDGLSRLL